MTTEFNTLNLHPQLVQALAERGYRTPTPIQAEIIPILLAGHDAIGQAQTGTGKTAAFALPILQQLDPDYNAVQALVLVPTRELAIQVAKAIDEYGQFRNVQVLAVYGGQSYGLQLGRLKRGVDIVVGTPGRLIDMIKRKALKIESVRTVVLDEADEMLSMGFVEDIETILSNTPAERQTALFSATLPPEIRRLADRYMRNPQSVAIKREQVTGDSIEQKYFLVRQSDKLAALTRLFEAEEVGSAIIFARTRVETGRLTGELTHRGYPAETLNGDLSQEARERTLNRFRQGLVKVLVATDVAARGLDIDNVSHVFNYDLPTDAEIYVHRIGRTGRAGKKGVAISLISPSEKRNLKQIESFARQKLVQASLPTADDMQVARENRLLEQVSVWLTRGRCKRERDMAEQLVALGHDPLDVAAAALKLARREDKQRPLETIETVVDFSDSRSKRPARNASRNSGRGRPGKESHEAGMVRLSLALGKHDGIRPNDIVGAIASHANIPGHAIGKIFIEEHHSLVDVPEPLVRQVLAKAGKARIHRQPLALRRV